MMLENDLDWMTQLNEEVWEYTQGDRFGHKTALCKRPLTGEEWTRIVEIIHTHDLHVSICPQGWFYIGFVVYAPQLVPEIPPEAVLGVNNQHIYEGARFPEGWKLFSSIALSEKNQQRHEYFFGERMSTSRAHYDY